MSSVEKLAIYVSVGTVLGGTSETDCYTCPENCNAEITEVRVAHSSGTVGAATVKWYDASATAAFVLKSGGVVPANDALVIAPVPLHLAPGDKIQVTGVSGQHVIVSGLQEPIRRTT